MLAPGERIDDRYEIIGTLGVGGMGHVYRARRSRLGDEVAIKVMQTGPEATPELRERFLRESRACAQLRHPNIVGILDFDLDARQQPFMVMELLSGPSLREEIELEAPMPVSRVADILESVASALDLAHERGITHRDLKPANIVVHRYDSGERVYKVIDFGLASLKGTSDETRLTNPGYFLGTMAYAAPEQKISGEAVTPAVDIYALGVVAYEMLAGCLPSDAAGGGPTVIVNQGSGQPERLAAKRVGLAGDVDRVVMRALAPDPAERWASAGEFIDALTQAAGGAGTSASAEQAGLLSRYELGPMLGRGRLGSVVYRGTHRALAVPVAIRILKRDEQPNWDTVRARFLLEARTLQVADPGLLQVRDFGEDERNVYLVTDLIEGPSLRQALAQSGAFPWDRAKALLGQALHAVSMLHEQGGFVSGVNPDMIRLRTTTTAESLIMSTAGIGSVQDVLATMREQELRGQEASELELPYVAPEILMGRPPSVAADIFTIGALAYQMVTAQPPFKAPSLPQLMGQMLQVAPADPASINQTVPPQAAASILRALAPDPSKRFDSAVALARSIDL